MIKFQDVNYKNYNDVLTSILKSLGHPEEDGFSLFVRLYTFQPMYSHIEPEWDLGEDFVHKGIIHHTVTMLNATLNDTCPLADTQYLLTKDYCNMLMVFLSYQRDFFKVYNIFFPVTTVNMLDIRHTAILADIESYLSLLNAERVSNIG